MLILVSVLIALIIGEIGLRVIFPTPQTIKIEQIVQRTKDDTGNYQLTLKRHPEEGGLYLRTQTGRRLRPNTRAFIENHSLSNRSVTISTNSLGYRNRELTAKHGTRILFLGDSITFGDYVEEDETFVKRIESLAQNAGLNWETINAGVGGISLKNEISILKETGLSTKPDMVVLGFYLNDYLESPGLYHIEPPRFLAWSRLLYVLGRAIPLGLAMLDVKNDDRIAKWRKDFEASLTSQSLNATQKRFYEQVVQRMDDWGGAWSKYSWETVAPLLHELKSLSEIHRFKLRVLIFPVKHQVEATFLEDFPQKMLLSTTKPLNIPLLDLLPILRTTHSSDGKRLFYDQCHHTPFGQKIIAKEVFEFLRDTID